MAEKEEEEGIEKRYLTAMWCWSAENTGEKEVVWKEVVWKEREEVYTMVVPAQVAGEIMGRSAGRPPVVNQRCVHRLSLRMHPRMYRLLPRMYRLLPCTRTYPVALTDRLLRMRLPSRRRSRRWKVLFMTPTPAEFGTEISSRGLWAVQEECYSWTSPISRGKKGCFIGEGKKKKRREEKFFCPRRN